MNASGIDLYTWATPNGWKASCNSRRASTSVYGVSPKT